MTPTFKYRKRTAVGGLAADLSAEVRAPDEDFPCRLRIHRNIYLSLPPEPLHWKDVAWLSFGLSLHAESLSILHPEGCTILVNSLTFPLSDYRAEVAALTMDGWLRHKFRFPDIGVDAVFDRTTGTYEFRWGPTSQPFSDDFA